MAVLTPRNSGHVIAVPLAGHACGRLVVNGESTRLTVRGDAPADHLALIRFSGSPAQVESVGDEVSIGFGHGGLFGLRAWLTGEHTEVVLARTVVVPTAALGVAGVEWRHPRQQRVPEGPLDGGVGPCPCT